MYETSTVTFGFTLVAPAVNASKAAFTGGISVPPMQPIMPDFVIEPATMPARYDGSSNEKLIAATFAPTVLPPVVM
jgi:hypothetical protein